MLTDEEAKKYMKRLIEYCDSRLENILGCIGCPLRTDDPLDCMGRIFDDIKRSIEYNG